MDSKPSFYPKHLAKQYTVGIWSDHEAGRAMRQQVGGDQVAPAPFVNGRNRTPVGNAGSSGANSNEVSPNSSSGSMDSSYMDHHGSKGFRQPGKKVLQGLPDSFIYSMKRLFTLLDVDNTGLVHIEGSGLFELLMLIGKNCQISNKNSQMSSQKKPNFF